MTGRRSSVGKRLFEAFGHLIRLTVSPENARAIAVYKTLGFREAGPIEFNYYGEQTGDDRYVMELQKDDYLPSNVTLT